MTNPLDAIKSEIAGIETRVRIAVETAILRESVRTGLSRLATLDTDRAGSYQAALANVGE